MLRHFEVRGTRYEVRSAKCESAKCEVRSAKYEVRRVGAAWLLRSILREPQDEGDGLLCYGEAGADGRAMLQEPSYGGQALSTNGWDARSGE